MPWRASPLLSSRIRLVARQAIFRTFIAFSLHLSFDVMGKGYALATKLRSEGERTMAFFSALPERDWQRMLYRDDVAWQVRDALEHLIQSEASLCRLFQQVVAGGEGAPAHFDIDRFNHLHTGLLAELSRGELLARFHAGREATANFAQALTDDQLAMRGRHPALGDASIEEMLKMIYLHTTMHMRDIKRTQVID